MKGQSVCRYLMSFIFSSSQWRGGSVISMSTLAKGKLRQREMNNILGPPCTALSLRRLQAAQLQAPPLDGDQHRVLPLQEGGIWYSCFPSVTQQESRRAFKPRHGDTINILYPHTRIAWGVIPAWQEWDPASKKQTENKTKSKSTPKHGSERAFLWAPTKGFGVAAYDQAWGPLKPLQSLRQAIFIKEIVRSGLRMWLCWSNVGLISSTV